MVMVIFFIWYSGWWLLIGVNKHFRCYHWLRLGGWYLFCVVTATHRFTTKATMRRLQLSLSCLHCAPMPIVACSVVLSSCHFCTSVRAHRFTTKATVDPWLEGGGVTMGFTQIYNKSYWWPSWLTEAVGSHFFRITLMAGFASPYIWIYNNCHSVERIKS